eukprot:2832188-Amphidinium_carterae.1
MMLLRLGWGVREFLVPGLVQCRKNALDACARLKLLILVTPTSARRNKTPPNGNIPKTMTKVYILRKETKKQTACGSVVIFAMWWTLAIQLSCCLLALPL